MKDPIQREDPVEREQLSEGTGRPDDADRDLVADPAERQTGAAGVPGVILVAENETSNRVLMEQILSMAGYQYVSATNGAEVLALLERYAVDVLLLDLSMPVLDGFRTMEIIRRTPELASLPIVAVTGHASREDREQALEAGCTDYLVKPFRTYELVAMVERMLALRHS